MVKGEQFGAENMWSETSSCQNWHQYYGLKSSPFIIAE